MRLMLNDFDGIDIPLEDSMLEAWRLQLDRAAQTRNTDALCRRLATCFAGSLAQCLDADLAAPTAKQIAYAMAISRELNVPISGDALRYRGSMAEFIGWHEASFKARRAARQRPRQLSDL